MADRYPPKITYDAYDMVADKYDHVTHTATNAAIYQSVFSLLPVELFRGARVLDVGCGTGRAISQLLSLGLELGIDYTYAGIDPSLSMLRQCERKYPSADLYHCRLADVYDNIDSPDFDVVVGLGVGQHLDELETDLVSLLAGRAWLITTDIERTPIERELFKMGYACQRSRLYRSIEGAHMEVHYNLDVAVGEHL